MAEFGGPLRVYDTTTGNLTLTLPLVVRSLALAPDGTLYATTLPETPPVGGRLHIFEPDAWPAARVLPYPCTPTPYTCTVSELQEGPDGRLYVADPEGQFVHIFDGQTAQLLHTLDIGFGPLNYLELALHDTTLYVGATQPNGGVPFVAVYDVAELVPTQLDTFAHATWGLHVSPDGRYLYSSQPEESVQYRTAPLTYVRTLDGRLQDVLPDGAVLATRQYGVRGFEAVAYDPETGEARRGLRHTNVSPRPVAQALADGGLALLHSDHVVLYIPSDYAAALPLVPVIRD